MHIAHTDAQPAPVAPASPRSAFERTMLSEHAERRKHAHTPRHPHTEGHTRKAHANGALRQLEEGHFKGVADVRLRINFHEEIAHRQQQQVQEIVQEGLATLTDTVAAHAETRFPPDRLTDEQAETFHQLFATFDASARDAGAAFAGSDGPDMEALSGALQDAFDTLHTALAHLLTPETAEPATTPTPPVTEEPADAETSDVDDAAGNSVFADFLNGLSEVFTHALENLKEAVQTVDVLPPLSRPAGNGKAYAKFVARYTQLYTATIPFGTTSFEMQA